MKTSICSSFKLRKYGDLANHVKHYSGVAVFSESPCESSPTWDFDHHINLQHLKLSSLTLNLTKDLLFLSVILSMFRVPVSALILYLFSNTIPIYLCSLCRCWFYIYQFSDRNVNRFKADIEQGHLQDWAVRPMIAFSDTHHPCCTCYSNPERLHPNL